MSTTQCSVCGTGFVPRFAFQVQRTADDVQYFCSQTCHEDHLFAADSRECSVCSETFRLQFAFQQVQVDGETRYFCSADCRQAELAEVERRRTSMRRIAVLNQKGGTGKTTTSVNVAAGLADLGYRVLLMDLDAQGNVAVSLGLSAQYTLYHVLVDGQHPTDCIVPVAPNLDAIISNTSLAQAEARLVTAAERYKVLAQRMSRITNYDYVIMDCAPSLSVLNQNALTFADHILIPVSCDYLSLVGVRQVLRTLKKVNEILLQPVSVLGVVPTFYDKRTKISAEAMSTLQAYFQDKVFPPIHVNTRLKEAPSHKKTIFEHDPDGRGAEDYRMLVGEIAERCGTTVAPAAPGRARLGSSTREVGSHLGGLFDTEAAVDEFFSPASRTRGLARRQVKARPAHYRTVSVTLYNEDLQRLDALLAELKRRGHTRANKSLIIREALRQIDLDVIPPQR